MKTENLPRRNTREYFPTPTFRCFTVNSLDHDVRYARRTSIFIYLPRRNTREYCPIPTFRCFTVNSLDHDVRYAPRTSMFILGTCFAAGPTTPITARRRPHCTVSDLRSLLSPVLMLPLYQPRWSPSPNRDSHGRRLIRGITTTTTLCVFSPPNSCQGFFFRQADPIAEALRSLQYSGMIGFSFRHLLEAAQYLLCVAVLVEGEFFIHDKPNSRVLIEAIVSPTLSYSSDPLVVSFRAVYGPTALQLQRELNSALRHHRLQRQKQQKNRKARNRNLRSNTCPEETRGTVDNGRSVSPLILPDEFNLEDIDCEISNSDDDVDRVDIKFEYPAPTECWPQLLPPSNIPGWECSYCTFVNQQASSLLSCQACNKLPPRRSRREGEQKTKGNQTVDNGRSVILDDIDCEISNSDDDVDRVYIQLDEESTEHDPAPTECWRQLPPPSNIPGWECSYCTFVNQQASSLLSCQACNKLPPRRSRREGEQKTKGMMKEEGRAATKQYHEKTRRAKPRRQTKRSYPHNSLEYYQRLAPPDQQPTCDKDMWSTAIVVPKEIVHATSCKSARNFDITKTNLLSTFFQEIIAVKKKTVQAVIMFRLHVCPHAVLGPTALAKFQEDTLLPLTLLDNDKDHPYNPSSPYHPVVVNTKRLSGIAASDVAARLCCWKTETVFDGKTCFGQLSPAFFSKSFLDQLGEVFNAGIQAGLLSEFARLGKGDPGRRTFTLHLGPNPQDGKQGWDRGPSNHGIAIPRPVHVKSKWCHERTTPYVAPGSRSPGTPPAHRKNPERSRQR